MPSQPQPGRWQNTVHQQRRGVTQGLGNLVGVADGYNAYTLLKVVEPIRDGVVKC